MIPKKIHYCWFGRNPYPEDFKKYLISWKKNCSDYELIEWNEDTFDITSNKYVQDAYEHKKWAFITDYVRLWALYNYGGVYMDTDVEVLKPIDEFLKNKAFSGFENPRAVPTGIMASEKGHSVIKELLDEYDNRHFINVDGSLNLHTNVEYITDYFVYHGLKLNNKYQIINEFALYPKEYFCPKNSRTLKIELTDNTYTIHHFAGSWTSDSIRLRAKIKKILGPNLMGIVIKIMDKIGVK
jgi:hypothetical protein